MANYAAVARIVSRDFELSPPLTTAVVRNIWTASTYELGAKYLRDTYGEDYAASIESRILQEMDQ